MAARARSTGNARRGHLAAVAVGLACAIAPGCGGGPADPGGATTAQAGAPSLRRLSAREYARAVEDLLGERVPVGSFLEETPAGGYDNGPTSLTVPVDQAAAYERVANALAAAALGPRRAHVIGACDPGRDGAEACKRVLLDGFAARAFRRPLDDEERATLAGLFDAEARDGGFDAGLEATVLAVLQSPAFLYRHEAGRLDAWQFASALSFFLTGSIPDEALLAAARAGRLETESDARREAARLLATPRGEEQLRLLLDEWLATTRLTETHKDRVKYAPLDDELRLAMRADLDGVYREALTGEGSLAALFETKSAFVDARLARLYGAPEPAPGAALPARIELDEATRRGVLTRAGYLTVHSGADTSNPIARGVFVRDRLLCVRPAAPPPGIPRAVGRESGRTTRERFAAHTQNAACQVCHAGIDGIGFGFEQFDPIGALRATEEGAPVDSSGELVGAREGDGPFRGVVELEGRLLRSSRFTACFARQVLRFALGTGETDDDEAALREITARFDARARIVDLVLHVAASRAFRERRPVGDVHPGGHGRPSDHGPRGGDVR